MKGCLRFAVNALLFHRKSGIDQCHGISSMVSLHHSKDSLNQELALADPLALFRDKQNTFHFPRNRNLYI